MGVSRSFLIHSLDLLSLIDGASARPMFGGYGLYADGAMFGLLDDDEIYLKTDEQCVAAFVEARCKQWVYPSPKGPMQTRYYRPPESAMESAAEMLPWAKLALGVSTRAQEAKTAKAMAKGKRKAASTLAPKPRAAAGLKGKVRTKAKGGVKKEPKTAHPRRSR